ncbi:MAG TPA: translation elongation factor Ts [Thermodesulfobacteriota bacterium]|nr:translation elongation factor Ts [Thermodesulfobacteriota bacterium]
MEIDAKTVKELRERTNAPMMDCKKALQEAGGNLEKAIDLLREKGLKTSQKKATRNAKDGLVSSYIHPGGKIGVLIEVNCETDFVARTDDFKELVKNLSMQIAASNPLYLKREDVPLSVLEKEKDIYRNQALREGKPEKIVDKIIAGKIEKFFSEVCLLEQSYVREPEVTIKELLDTTIGKLGENIIIRRFCRFQLGEIAE